MDCSGAAFLLDDAEGFITRAVQTLRRGEDPPLGLASATHRTLQWCSAPQNHGARSLLSMPKSKSASSRGACACTALQDVAPVRHSSSDSAKRIANSLGLKARF
jgi:hypothetical protein